VARAHFPRWQFEPATLSHAHNSYLTVTAETGVVGLGIFLMFWLVLVREQWNEVVRSRSGGWKKAAAIASIAGIAAFLVAAFFEHNLLTATAILALSFIIGLSRLEDGPSVPVDENGEEELQA
jgi:O-antigen ligase